MAITAYADDVTLQVCSPDPSVTVTHLSKLTQIAYDWGKESDMILSKKSVFMMIASSSQRRIDIDNSQLKISIRRGATTTAPRQLVLKRGRFEAASNPQNDIDFVVTLAPQRLLGVWIDYLLNFHHHAQVMRGEAESHTSRLKVIARYLHPKVARSIALSIGHTMIYGTEATWSHWADISKHSVDKFWPEVVKVAGGIIRTAGTADALLEMECTPLEAMILERRIAWQYQRSSKPIISLPYFAHMRTADPADRQISRSTVLSTPIDPCAELGLAPIENLIRWRLPHSPPPREFDKVSFITSKPIKGEDPDRKLVENACLRAQALGRLAGLRVIEGWSDGSVNPEEDAAGGAAIVFHNTQETTIRSRRLSGAPPHACSYTAEIFAALELCDLLRSVMEEDRDLLPAPGILICTDSLSWMTHIVRGPHVPGTLAPKLWNALAPLARAAEKIVICHQFSHCNDTRGDMVDKVAKEGASLNKILPKAWHVDAARPARREATAMIIEQLQVTRTSFHRTHCPTKQRSDESLVAVPKLPPDRLAAQQARTILRLRTGYWPPLGVHTYIHSASGDHVCLLCNSVVLREHGGWVAHIFVCVAASLPQHRPCPANLWSEEQSKLTGVTDFAYLFVPMRGQRATPSRPGRAITAMETLVA